MVVAKANGYRQLGELKALLSDIPGLKIRTVATPLQQELLTELKANPTTMTFADAQAALASGAIDGLTLTMEQVVAYKMHTLGQKFVTNWNLFNELIHFSVANPIWKTWTPEDQKLVRSAARDASLEMTAAVRKSLAGNEAGLRKLGVDIYNPTPAELTQWRTATRRVYARWKATTNAPLATRIEEVVTRATQA